MSWWDENYPDAGGPTEYAANSVRATPADVAAIYQEVLHRAPESDSVAQSWIDGTGGDLAAIRSGIAGSDEAKALANQPAASTAPAAKSTRAQIAEWAAMPGADPSLASDPGYWERRINETGGLNDSNRQYWQNASVGPTAFFNNPNREGGSASAPSAGFGATPSPYASNPNAPAVPDAPAPLSPYVQPTWTGGDFTPTPKPAVLQAPYTLPTLAELQASPGYMGRLEADQKARERSAAAKGSVLNGGTQKALGEAAQTFASNEYGNLVGESLGARQQNAAEYNADDSNAFRNYLQRYGQFQDAASRDFGARQENVSESNLSFGQGQQVAQSRYQQYLGENNRTLSDYLTNVTTKRNAENDLWSRLNDLYQTGAGLAGNSYKPGIGTA